MISTILITLLTALCGTATAKNYYFDGSARTNGNGQRRHPFNTLESISDLHLAPGDSLLLRRGTRFVQSLELSVGGSAGAPIIIQPYGDTSLPDPAVSAAANQLSTVLLNGTSHVVVQELEISNPGDNQTARRGVYVYAQDAGEVTDITLRSLYVHDVQGYMPSTTNGSNGVGKYANASGGIVLETSGNRTATYFTDILIENNRIESVARQGIYTWSNWCRRDALAAFWFTLCFQPWHPWSGLRIQDNFLRDISGDGIVVTGNVDAVTSGNSINGFNSNSSDTNNAGIWTANSDGSIFQYNTVSGGQTNKDGKSTWP